MTNRKSGEHYHDKGEEDASKGKYEPPVSPPMMDTEKGRSDRADYDKGWRNTTDQTKR